MTRHFTRDWVEHATLHDGTRVLLRLIRADDAELVRTGFERLSPASRYLRFHTPKPRLSDDELRYLCDVDQEAHVAIGAQRDDGTTPPVGLGIARAILLPGAPGEPPTAEAAVAVTDDTHGKGLGKLLFLRLVAAAHERGVARFRCEVLGSNTAMQQLLGQLALPHARSVDSGVVSFDVPLPEVAPDAPITTPPPGPMYDVLRAAASEKLELLSRDLSASPGRR